MSANNKLFSQFMQDNQELLECYASIEHPYLYKVMPAATQRDFCYTERLRVEEYLIKNKLKAEDFWPKQMQ